MPPAITYHHSDIFMLPTESLPSDAVVHLQQVGQWLSIAYNSHQGSTFCKQFAVKMDLGDLSPEQRAQRQFLLRMLGTLIDTEFEQTMDKLCEAWLAYRSVQK